MMPPKVVFEAPHLYNLAWKNPTRPYELQEGTTVYQIVDIMCSTHQEEAQHLQGPQALHSSYLTHQPQTSSWSALMISDLL
jgi:hypothetical protein